MRILFFSHYFPPEVGAPAARIYENAKFWAQKGNQVTVVTGFPNHPTGVIPEEFKGKIFQKESKEGINILRTWVFASRNKGFKKRSISFLSSMLSSIFFCLNPFVRGDIVVGSSPQLLTPLAAYIVSRIKRKPFVLEIRDLWPKVIVELEMLKEDSRIIRLLTKMELFLYKKAKKIVVVSESFKDYIVSLGVESEKIEVIPNGVDFSFFNRDIDGGYIRQQLAIKDKYIVLYCGNHGMAQDLSIVVQSAEILRKNKEIFFLFVGDGPEKESLEEMAKSKNLNNLAFLPSQPREKILDFYKAADVCLVPLKKLELLHKFIPSKLFEIMACEKPVIASLAGEAERIVNSSGGGLVVPPGDPQKLSDAIIHLFNNKELSKKLARSGKEFVSKYYNRKNLAENYLEVLREAILGEYSKQKRPDYKGIPASLWIINQCFYPDIDATAQLLTELGEDLADKGMRVTVITGRNQKKYPTREIYNGINIVRGNVFRLNKKNLFFRYINYLSLFPSLFIRALFLPRADYILVVSSPPFVYFLGWLLKVIKHSKLIFNTQDLYPDVAVKLRLLRNSMIIRLLQKYTLKMYQNTDKIICIGEIMCEHLLKRGAPTQKIEIVHNWADNKFLFNIDKKDNPLIVKRALEEKFIVQYAGNFGMIHEIDTILETAKILSNRPEIAFVFNGDGVHAGKIRDFIRDKQLSNVLIFPYQPREKLNLSLNACDVSLVTMKQGFQGTFIPSKIYGVMATGKPVLAICPLDSEVGRIIKEEGCGVIVQPGDINGCATKLVDLYENSEKRRLMGEKGRKALIEKYDRRIATERYYKIINET